MNKQELTDRHLQILGALSLLPDKDREEIRTLADKLLAAAKGNDCAKFALVLALSTLASEGGL